MTATPAKEPRPIPEQMWKDLAELDEQISLAISAKLREHREKIVAIGHYYDFEEAELYKRGVLIMTSLGTAAAGQGARRA